MKIAFATETRDPNGVIAMTLADAPFLLIADLDKKEILEVVTANKTDREMVYAKKTVEHKCELIICGDIEEKDAFETLSDDGVTRQRGAGLTVTQATKAMLSGTLPYIKDHVGGNGCPGEDETKIRGLNCLGMEEE
ncbi:MAG: NifB/NifX family molybdenum-iron cluster-binding protein [Oscillospiraceae bacterium]